MLGRRYTIHPNTKEFLHHSLFPHPCPRLSHIHRETDISFRDLRGNTYYIKSQKMARFCETLPACLKLPGSLRSDSRCLIL